MFGGDEQSADLNGHETASDTPRNTQIQRSCMSDLPFHAGFEVRYPCLLPSFPLYIHWAAQIIFSFWTRDER